jgi:hypothetical protein
MSDSELLRCGPFLKYICTAETNLPDRPLNEGLARLYGARKECIAASARVFQPDRFSEIQTDCSSPGQFLFGIDSRETVRSRNAYSSPLGDREFGLEPRDDRIELSLSCSTKRLFATEEMVF